jgi:hypothetical protein
MLANAGIASEAPLIFTLDARKLLLVCGVALESPLPFFLATGGRRRLYAGLRAGGNAGRRAVHVARGRDRIAIAVRNAFPQSLGL